MLPYFFAKRAKELDRSTFARPSDLDAIEVDRCVYDNMVDKAVVDPEPAVGASACRATPLAEVKFMHFTVCQKPWSCNPNRGPDDPDGLCLGLHRTWFAKRRAFEAARGMPSEEKACRRGYIPMQFPDL